MDTRELLILSYESFRKGNNEEAYQVIMDNKEFIGKDSMLISYIFSLASKLNKVEDAMFYFQEAIINYEFWYRADQLDQDSDLDSIRDLPEYKKLYNINKKRELECKYAGVKKIDIDVPESNPMKLFFMLHGNSQYVERIKKTFNPTSIEGHIIALPQSREFQAFQNYSWNNVKFGLEVCEEHYREVIAEYKILEDDIILSSYSTGAEVILRGLSEGILPAKKAIFFTPWMPNLEKLEKEIHILKEKDIQIFLVCGAEDKNCLPTSNRFDELLTKYNVNHRYLVIKDLGQSLPKDVKPVIDEAFTYFNIKN